MYTETNFFIVKRLDILLKLSHEHLKSFRCRLCKSKSKGSIKVDHKLCLNAKNFVHFYYKDMFTISFLSTETIVDTTQECHE